MQSSQSQRSEQSTATYRTDHRTLRSQEWTPSGSGRSGGYQSRNPLGTHRPGTRSQTRYGDFEPCTYCNETTHPSHLCPTIDYAKAEEEQFERQKAQYDSERDQAIQQSEGETEIFASAQTSPTHTKAEALKSASRVEPTLISYTLIKLTTRHKPHKCRYR